MKPYTPPSIYTASVKDYLLLFFPAILLGCLFLKAKLNKKGEFSDNAWSLEQSKNLQGIAALMIIVHHLAQAVTQYEYHKKGPINEFCSFGILMTAIFFFFSGYGLYSSYQNKTDYLKNFLQKRFPVILVPFLITNLVYIISNGGERLGSALDLMTSILGITLINTNAWFVVELLILYLAFYILFRRIQDAKKALTALTAFSVLLVLISMLLCHDQTSINGHWFFGEWWYNETLLFPFGMLIARNESTIQRYLKKHYRLSLSVFSVLFLLGYLAEEWILKKFGYYQEWLKHPGYGSKLLTLFFQVLLGILFLLLILTINLKVSFQNKALHFLSSISFEIYLVQDIFIQNLYNPDKMPDLEYFALVFLFTIPTAMLLKLASRFVLSFWEDYLKRPQNKEALTYEANQKFRRWELIVKCVRNTYLVVAVLMLILAAIRLYQNTIEKDKQYQAEVDILRNARVGDEILFGTWELDYSNGETEDIPWIVADSQDGHLLIISKLVLNNMSYNDRHMEVDWLSSYLCKSLNYFFYREAFTKKERALLTGRFDESFGGWCNDEFAAISYRKDNITVHHEFVFLLTEAEVLRYFPTDESRIAKVSNAAYMEGLGSNAQQNRSGYWISEQGSCALTAKYVTLDGTIDSEGKWVNNSGLGVRPAIWVTIP